MFLVKALRCSFVMALHSGASAGLFEMNDASAPARVCDTAHVTHK
jgi:hypothetical protein